MVNIQKCQARTRIGVMRISGQKGFRKPRTLGEIFEMDLDDPIQSAAYKHLIANGALKPIGQATKVEPDAGKPAEAEVVESAPVVDEPTCRDDTGKAVTDVSEPAGGGNGAVVPAPEPIGPGTKLLYIFDSYRTEIEFLTEDQIDTLRRIGVKTVADIDTRTDQDITSVPGVGKGKARQLRELYDRYGGG